MSISNAYWELAITDLNLMINHEPTEVKFTSKNQICLVVLPRIIILYLVYKKSLKIQNINSIYVN